MHKKLTLKTGIAAALMLAFGMGAVQAQAQEVVRLGNLKFAHYGAVSYIKEIAPKCGIKVEEHIFAKGLDVMQAIIAGELDVGATASEAAISGRAGGAPIYVVAGFAKGGALAYREGAKTDERHGTTLLQRGLDSADGGLQRAGGGGLGNVGVLGDVLDQFGFVHRIPSKEIGVDRSRIGGIWFFPSSRPVLRGLQSSRQKKTGAVRRASD